MRYKVLNPKDMADQFVEELEIGYSLMVRINSPSIAVYDGDNYLFTQWFDSIEFRDWLIEAYLENKSIKDVQNEQD